MLPFHQSKLKIDCFENDGLLDEMIRFRTAGEVCPLLVQKCLGLPKQKLRDKAQEIMLLYIEVEKPDVVIVSGFLVLDYDMGQMNSVSFRKR